MKKRIEISAGGVLLLAALYYFLAADELAALLLAAAAHELGHIAAIHLTGCRVSSIRLCASGAVINRSASLTPAREALCALSGPVAGALYAVLIAPVFPLSAGMSLCLSIFNALPALPLDGGRALECLMPRRAVLLCSLITASALLMAGLIFSALGMGTAPALAGALLLLAQTRL